MVCTFHFKIKISQKSIRSPLTIVGDCPIARMKPKVMHCVRPFCTETAKILRRRFWEPLNSISLML